jgi:hypothetical protein
MSSIKIQENSASSLKFEIESLNVELMKDGMIGSINDDMSVPSELNRAFIHDDSEMSILNGSESINN